MPAHSKTSQLCYECRKNGHYIKAPSRGLCNDHLLYKFEPVYPTPESARDVATATYHIQSHKLDKVIKKLEHRKHILTEVNRLRTKHIMAIKMELLAELSYYNKLKRQADQVEILGKEISNLRGQVDDLDDSQSLTELHPNPTDFDYLSWRPVDDCEKELFRDAIVDLDKEYVQSLVELNENIKELVPTNVEVEPVVEPNREKDTINS